MTLSCRFYKNRLPDIDENVMVIVKHIGDVGVDVQLLEYGHQPGMILSTELSRRRIRSIHDLVRLNREEVGQVIRIDKEKGYIDLSKRRVSPEEKAECQEKFARGKTVHSILRHTAEVVGIDNDEDFEILYEKVAWFYDEKHQSPGAVFDVFNRAASNEHELDDCLIDERTRSVLLENIRRRLTAPPVQCRSDFHLAYFGYEGIDLIKAALRAGLSVSTEEMPIKINLIATPLYKITTTTTNQTQGFAALQRALDLVKKTILKYDGTFRIKTESHVVVEQDKDQKTTVLTDSELSLSDDEIDVFEQSKDQTLPSQSLSADEEEGVHIESNVELIG